MKPNTAARLELLNAMEFHDALIFGPKTVTREVLEANCARIHRENPEKVLLCSRMEDGGTRVYRRR